MPPSLQDEIDRVLSKLQINTAKLLKILFGKIKEDFVNLDTTKRKLWTDEVNKNITSYFSPPPLLHTHCPLSPPTSIIMVHNCKKKISIVFISTHFAWDPPGLTRVICETMSLELCVGTWWAQQSITAKGSDSPPTIHSWTILETLLWAFSFPRLCLIWGQCR